MGAVSLAVVVVGSFGSPAVSGRCVTYPPALSSDPDVEVCGLVLATYLDLDGARGPLRKPVESEQPTRDGYADLGDRVTSFSGGGVYRDTTTGAITIPGFWFSYTPAGAAPNG